MMALERKAHKAFSSSRFSSDGGTEYFAVNPDDVLTWLRAEAPRVAIDSARNNAWHEYVESRPWKLRGRVGLFCFGGFIISCWIGCFWELAKHDYWMALAVPFIAAAIFGASWYFLKQALLANNETELRFVRSTLEEKYHLPPDILILTTMPHGNVADKRGCDHQLSIYAR